MRLFAGAIEVERMAFTYQANDVIFRYFTWRYEGMWPSRWADADADADANAPH